MWELITEHTDPLEQIQQNDNHLSLDGSFEAGEGYLLDLHALWPEPVRELPSQP